MWIRTRWEGLSTGGKLAVVAIGLGGLALFARPHRPSRATVDLDELAAVIQREEDHIHADELAAWIVEGRNDYRLLDVRSEAEYAAYHIPTAENVPLAALPRADLPRDLKIVLYSEGGIHASQAWMLLWARGLRSIYTVKGGLAQWQEDVLYPVPPATPTATERARFERAAALARFFGGSPRAAASAASSTQPAAVAAPPAIAAPPAAPPGSAAPVLAPRPVTPAATTPPAAPRAKKEGC